MRKIFVPTGNYQRFTTGIKAVEGRGAGEAGMMLVHGLPGYGKSHIVSHWATEVNAVFLRANVDWTPKYFLIELAKALGLDQSGHAQTLFARLLEKIVELQHPIVIDEAEFTLPNHAAVLEKIRDFSDRAEVTVVLIGMERIQQKIARFKQIHSRIAQVVEFTKATPTDVSHACASLAEVEITPAMVEEIHRISAGRMREVLNIIAVIERVAKVNGLKSVDVPDMKDVPLSYDWNARTAATVKQAKR